MALEGRRYSKEEGVLPTERRSRLDHSWGVCVFQTVCLPISDIIDNKARRSIHVILLFRNHGYP